MDPARNKEMLTQEVIQKLEYFSKLYGIESLFIAGGYCRDLYMGRVGKVNDIDIASAYPNQAAEFGGLFASEVLNKTPIFNNRIGTAKIIYPSLSGEIKIEFQGKSPMAYMYNQEVREWLHKKGIADEPIMHNIYGRDFTINSLIYSLHNESMYDLTDRAVQDIKDKRIVPLLPAWMLVKHNPLVILRAIRFAVTYDFKIGINFRTEIKNGYDILLSSVSEDRIVKEIVRILKIDTKKAIDLFQNLEIEKILLNPKIKDHITNESQRDE